MQTLQSEMAPPGFRVFSADDMERFAQFRHHLDKKPPRSKQTRWELVNPFSISTLRGQLAEADFNLAYSYTVDAIQALLKCQEPDRRALGVFLQNRLASSIDGAVSFANLASGSEIASGIGDSAIRSNEMTITPNTSARPIEISDNEYLLNMADVISETKSHEEIQFSLPYSLYRAYGSRTGNLAGSMDFSLSGIKADIALPTSFGRFGEINGVPSAAYQESYREFCHTEDLSTAKSIQLRIEALSRSQSPQDNISLAIAQSQDSLRHTHVGIASRIASPTDPQSMAQLYIRGGLVDDGNVIPAEKSEIQVTQDPRASGWERSLERNIKRFHRAMTESKEAGISRGPYRPEQELQNAIAQGLLTEIGERFQQREGNEVHHIGSANEVTIKCKSGESFVVKMHDGRLSINYGNPPTFRTNPGETWLTATEQLNDVIRTVYSFYGLDVVSAKLDIPSKYQEVAVPNLELMTPGNTEGRMQWVGEYDEQAKEWVGAYKSETLEKIHSAENAVIQHFNTDLAQRGVAPNIMIDGTSGMGKTFVSTAMARSFSERLGARGVKCYRLGADPNADLRDIIRDIKTWARMKGDSVLLVEDLFQKLKDRPQAEVAMALNAFNDVSKQIAQSKNHVMIVNTEYLDRVIAKRRAVIGAHRYPHFIELKPDLVEGHPEQQTAKGIENAFRTYLARYLNREGAAIRTPISQEVKDLAARLTSVTGSQKSLWEELSATKDSSVITMGLIENIWDKALVLKDKQSELVDGETILGIARGAIAEEKARIQTEVDEFAQYKEKIDLMWDALSPIADLTGGSLSSKGFETLLAMIDQHKVTTDLMKALIKARPDLFTDAGMDELRILLVEGKSKNVTSSNL